MRFLYNCISGTMCRYNENKLAILQRAIYAPVTGNPLLDLLSA